MRKRQRQGLGEKLFFFVFFYGLIDCFLQFINPGRKGFGEKNRGKEDKQSEWGKEDKQSEWGKEDKQSEGSKKTNKERGEKRNNA